nr:MAG TPA: Fic family protein [Caudoviricetes sp.]
MKYEPLNKIYYKDQENFEKIYQSRLNGDYSITLDFSIHDMPAFFVQTPDVSRLLLQIYKMERKIFALRSALPGVALNQFTRRCLIDEIVLTNSIEGVNSTRRDISEILDDLKKEDRKKRFRGLVQKYSMLQDNTNIALASCQDLRNIYDELVLEEVREEDPKDVPDGEIFRNGPVYVYSGTQKTIHTGTYPESAIICAVEKALNFLNDENIEILIRISIFHYLIGYIHPFYNGNGRLSRFVSSYLLSRDLEPLLSYRLSYTIKENIKEYYDAFKICNDKKNRGDLTPFLLMFLNIVYTATNQLHEALIKRFNSLSMYADVMSKVSYISSNNEIEKLGYLLIQAELFSEKGISTQELLECIQVSRMTLSNRLKIFSEHHLLLCDRDGKKNYYRINLETLMQLAKLTE